MIFGIDGMTFVWILIGGTLVIGALMPILFGVQGQYYLTKNARLIGQFSSQPRLRNIEIEALVVVRDGVANAGLLVHTGSICVRTEKLDELIALFEQLDTALDQGVV